MCACKHPLKGWPIGVHPSGKPNYYISSYDTDHVEIRQGVPVPCATKFFNSSVSERIVRNFIEIPCGQCISCRLARSREWADRCMLELQYHKSSYFVTLTYDDDHLPLNDFIDSETGEFGKSASLVKKDMQDFFKRLRRNYEYSGKTNKLRYYMCGEYGSQTYRPHYHAIIFGLELDDLVPFKKTNLGHMLYNSPFLAKCWQHKGYVVAAEVTWETCAYTARYILKKQYGSAAEIYDRLNILPEFTQMSLKPAIGRDYYDEHKDDIYKYDKIHLRTKQGGLEIRPPRYYDRLFDIDYPEESKIMKEQRKRFAENATKFKLNMTSKDYLEMLKTEENNLKSKIDKALPRKEI